MKSLLVVFEGSDAALARLGTACELARVLDAHLAVLAVTRMPPLLASTDPGGAAEIGEIYLPEVDDARARLADAAKRFRKRASLRTCASCRSSREASLRTLARHARYADLTLTGQPGGGDDEPLVLDALDGALFDSGRPLVTVPPAWGGRGLGRRILLAWDGGREAARAAGDALALLTRAETVFVAVVAPKIGFSGHGEEPGADIATALARHGASVEVDVVAATRLRTSEVLLGRARALGADLVVMGAYGHSRFRETVFGGVTHEMIEDATLPLFLSH